MFYKILSSAYNLAHFVYEMYRTKFTGYMYCPQGQLNSWFVCQ